MLAGTEPCSHVSSTKSVNESPDSYMNDTSRHALALDVVSQTDAPLNRIAARTCLRTGPNGHGFRSW